MSSIFLDGGGGAVPQKEGKKDTPHAKDILVFVSLRGEKNDGFFNVYDSKDIGTVILNLGLIDLPKGPRNGSCEIHGPEKRLARLKVGPSVIWVVLVASSIMGMRVCMGMSCLIDWLVRLRMTKEDIARAFWKGRGRVKRENGWAVSVDRD